MRINVWSCPSVPGPQHGDAITAITPVVAFDIARRRRVHGVGSDFYSSLRVLEVARTTVDIDEQIAASDSDAAHYAVTALDGHVVGREVDIHPRCSVDELGGPEDIGYSTIMINALGCVGRIPNRVVRRVIVDFRFARAILRIEPSPRPAVAWTIRRWIDGEPECRLPGLLHQVHRQAVASYRPKRVAAGVV